MNCRIHCFSFFCSFFHLYTGSLFLERIDALFPHIFFESVFPSKFRSPFLLCPGISITINLLQTYSSSLLITWPCQFSLLSCFFELISATFTVPRIISFLILPLLVTPHIQHNILIYAPFIFFSCAFFTAKDSLLYSIAGRTAFLFTLPFSLTFIFLSHSTPNSFLLEFHPHWI